MTDCIEVVLEGRPVPWARVRRSRFGRAWNHPKQLAHRTDLAQLLRAAAGHGGQLLGPVALEMIFEYSDGHVGGRTTIRLTQPSVERGQIRRPDLDNLQKQVLEALEQSGLVRDDAQVVEVRAVKIRRER